jgi:3',5'-cyclic-AMP phosphodiesterase
VLKILQVTDLHIMQAETDTLLGVNTDYYFRQVLAHAHAEQGPFDLILVTGDLAQEPCHSSYLRIREHLQRYPAPAVCLPGNHDDYNLMQDVLNAGSVSCSKQVLLPPWRIVCLNSQKINSPVGQLSPTEFAFLNQSLSSHPQTPTLVAAHHPCIPTGSSWLDTMQITNSTALLDLLDRHLQVKAFTCGHVHQPMAHQHNHVNIFSTPATCFQFEPHSNEFRVATTSSGYRIFELHDNGGLESACHYLEEPLQGLSMQAHGY